MIEKLAMVPARINLQRLGLDPDRLVIVRALHQAEPRRRPLLQSQRYPPLALPLNQGRHPNHLSLIHI